MPQRTKKLSNSLFWTRPEQQVRLLKGRWRLSRYRFLASKILSLLISLLSLTHTCSLLSLYFYCVTHTLFLHCLSLIVIALSIFLSLLSHSLSLPLFLHCLSLSYCHCSLYFFLTLCHLYYSTYLTFSSFEHPHMLHISNSIAVTLTHLSIFLCLLFNTDNRTGFS